MGQREGVEKFTDFVTTHNRLVIVLFVILTAGIVFGVTQDAGEAEQGIDEDAMGDTEVGEAAEYISETYGEDADEGETQVTVDVFVKTDEDTVLDRKGLLTALDYQLAVSEKPAVDDRLADDGISGPPNMIATALAEDPDADLETQREVVANASEDEVAAAVETTFTGGEATRFYLPTTYEAGTTDAEAMRLTFTFAEAEETEMGTSAPPDAQEVLYETAGEYDEPAIFTTGQFARADLQQEFLMDSLWLVLPPILLVLLIILGFAYRDVTDVLIGFAGSLVALAWTFGLMGWMGLLSQQTRTDRSSVDCRTEHRLRVPRIHALSGTARPRGWNSDDAQPVNGRGRSRIPPRDGDSCHWVPLEPSQSGTHHPGSRHCHHAWSDLGARYLHDACACAEGERGRPLGTVRFRSAEDRPRQRPISQPGVGHWRNSCRTSRSSSARRRAGSWPGRRADVH